MADGFSRWRDKMKATRALLASAQSRDRNHEILELCREKQAQQNAYACAWHPPNQVRGHGHLEPHIYTAQHLTQDGPASATSTAHQEPYTVRRVQGRNNSASQYTHRPCHTQHNKPHTRQNQPLHLSGKTYPRHTTYTHRQRFASHRCLAFPLSW